MEPTKVKFFFKSKKDKDENGNVIKVKEVEEIKDKDGKVTELKETGKLIDKVIPAPPPLELDIPLLTLDDIIAMINGTPQVVDGVETQVRDEKQIKLLVEAVNAPILEQAREQVNDPDSEVRTKGLNLSVITFEHIANLPPAQRRGAGISDEKWDAFILDYVDVMQHHGKSEDKAKAGAKLLRQKYQPVKSNKKVIAALKDNLQVWFTNTSDENKEEFQDVYENLVGKADELLAKDEDAIIAAI